MNAQVAYNDDVVMSEDEADTIPFSLEAEQALLGALLYDNEIYHRISDVVKVGHFYDGIHARIFDAIAVLIEHGKLADGIVLKNRFAQDETLQDIGGVEYIALLMDSAANSVNAPEYARMIHGLAIRRDLIRLADEMGAQARDAQSEDTPTEMIEAVEAELFALAETGARKRGFIPFETAIIESINAALAAYNRDGGLSGLSTGLLGVDDKLGGLHKSDLIILAGRPSMGKTALATNIAYRVAKAHHEEKRIDGTMETVSGGRVGFFSLEMSSEQLATRILSEQARIPSTTIRKGHINGKQYEDIRDVAHEMSSIPLFIDDTGGLSVGALCARARRLKRLQGLDLIVIDYIQLLNGGKQLRRTDGRVQEVTLITTALKALAKELDVPILALAQLSRQVEQRDDKRPQLSDLRESGSIEQDADVVAFVFREEYYHERLMPPEDSEAFLEWSDKADKIAGKAELIIGKQRHGPIGTVPLKFEGTFTSFSDLGDGE